MKWPRSLGTFSGKETQDLALSIAGLIGRQIAREHFEALQAANDNSKPEGEADAREGQSTANEDE